MNKKTLIIAGGTILGVLILLILVIWLMTIFKTKYFNYETVEEKIINATSNYYKEHSDLLPVSDGRFTLSYNTLVENGYIKPLNELLKDGDECSAEIYVIRNDGNFTYVPKLSCGANYTSVELYKQILAKTDVVETGSGLYKAEDGSYYFRGKATNNYIVLGEKTVKKEQVAILWQIMSISNDGIIKIRALEPTPTKTEYDNRFNVDKNSNIGYNDFELGIIHSYLNDLAKGEAFLTSQEKAKLVPTYLCAGMRAEDDTTKDGSTECSTLSSDKMLFGTLTPYEYMRASLDDDCITTISKACSNYNFLSNSEATTQWIITANPKSNYEVYEFNGKYFEASNARNKKVIYVTANLNDYVFYKSGTGTKDDPYKIFKN